MTNHTSVPVVQSFLLFKQCREWYMLYLLNFVLTDPAFQDTSGSSPHFMLATGGNDNLVKLWDIFTASGINNVHVLLWFCHYIDSKETLLVHNYWYIKTIYDLLMPFIVLICSTGFINFYVLISAFSEECHIRKRCSLSGHQGPVHGVAMSPNGKILASGYVHFQGCLSNGKGTQK